MDVCIHVPAASLQVSSEGVATRVEWEVLGVLWATINWAIQVFTHTAVAALYTFTGRRKLSAGQIRL